MVILTLHHHGERYLMVITHLPLLILVLALAFAVSHSCLLLLSHLLARFSLHNIISTSPFLRLTQLSLVTHTVHTTLHLSNTLYLPSATHFSLTLYISSSASPSSLFSNSIFYMHMILSSLEPTPLYAKLPLQLTRLCCVFYKSRVFQG